MAQVTYRPTVDRSATIAMQKYLHDTFYSVVNLGWEAKPFPWKEQNEKQAFFLLTFDKLSGSGVVDDNSIMKYLMAVLGDSFHESESAVSAIIKAPDYHHVSIQKNTQVKQDDDNDDDNFDRFAKMFIHRVNMSAGMLRVCAWKNDIREGMLKGARYALSDTRKFDFFVKHSVAIPQVVMTRLERQGITYDHDKKKWFCNTIEQSERKMNAYVLQAMNADQKIVDRLDDELVIIIEGLSDRDVNIESDDLKEHIWALALIEKYILANFRWQAKTEKTEKHKRDQKERHAPINEDGQQSDFGVGISVSNTPGDKIVGKPLPVSVRTPEEVQEQINVLLDISFPIIESVRDLCSDLSDWLRNVVIDEEMWRPIGSVAEGKLLKVANKKGLTSKQKKDWLQWADIIMCYGAIVSRKMQEIVKHENRVIDSVGSIAFRAHRAKATFVGSDFVDGKVVDWKPPIEWSLKNEKRKGTTLRAITTNEDFQNEDTGIRAIIKLKKQILEYPDYSGKTAEVAKIINQQSPYFDISESFVTATFLQGEEGIVALKTDYYNNTTKYRDYLNFRIIRVLPGMLYLKTKYPVKYNVAVMRAFFSLTSVHHGVCCPAQLDENDELIWKHDKKRPFNHTLEKPNRIPALNIGGRRNMLDGEKTNTELLYDILEVAMDPKYCRALEEAGTRPTSSPYPDETDLDFVKQRITSKRRSISE